MSKEFSTRLTQDAKFDLKSGQSLVINFYNAPSDMGMERIVVNFDKDKKVAEIRATGHGTFEFKKRKDGADPSYADFILQNPDIKVTMKDYIKGLFWSQFNWGELIRLNNDKNFQKRFNRAVNKLVSDFESTASAQLNSLEGVPKRVKRQSPKR